MNNYLFHFLYLLQQSKANFTPKSLLKVCLNKKELRILFRNSLIFKWAQLGLNQ